MTRFLIAGAHRLELGGRTRIMGIVNATPDSFFDRGQYFSEASSSPAIQRGLELAALGADIIDVGGETAQPDSPVLAPEEEIRRVVPVIETLAHDLSVPISCDTYKPEVAEAAIRAGASIINDTSGLADERLAQVAADTGAALVCMHIPCHPKERITPGYADPIGAVTEFLMEKTRTIEAAGVPKDRIIVDPGIGFGKTDEENLDLIAHTRALTELGYALLFACSRRTFLGRLMNPTEGLPPEARLEPTVAVNAVAMLNGADVIRVHDVDFFAKLARMLWMVRQKGD